MQKMVVMFETTDIRQKEYDAILKELDAMGRLYQEKRISHVSFDRNGTWCVVDVWESADALNEFVQNALVPVFTKLGLEMTQPTVLPAYNYIGAHAEESMSA